MVASGYFWARRKLSKRDQNSVTYRVSKQCPSILSRTESSLAGRGRQLSGTKLSKNIRSIRPRWHPHAAVSKTVRAVVAHKGLERSKNSLRIPYAHVLNSLPGRAPGRASSQFQARLSIHPHLRACIHIIRAPHLRWRLQCD